MGPTAASLIKPFLIFRRQLPQPVALPHCRAWTGGNVAGPVAAASFRVRAFEAYRNGRCSLFRRRAHRNNGFHHSRTARWFARLLHRLQVPGQQVSAFSVRFSTPANGMPGSGHATPVLFIALIRAFLIIKTSGQIFSSSISLSIPSSMQTPSF